MDRDTAVTRITDGLGFVTAHAPKAILRLQEAQRDLEKGKTLPNFLINPNETITTVAGTISYLLPARFLRFVDQAESPMFFFSDASDVLPIFLRQATLTETLAEFSGRSDRGEPELFILIPGTTTINLYPPPDAAYVIGVNFYQGGEILTSNIENSWLEHAPEWLIGEAGLRLAADLRDVEAVSLFQATAQKGRAACFGETLAAEQQFAPISMGMSL